jgi:hypothetical protein
VKKKKVKAKTKEDPKALEKLVHLTKLINKEQVKIEPKGFVRGPNKWRSQDPKFAPKPEKPDQPLNVVEAGGMQVDPALAEQYENWRKDKMAEQEERRIQARRKWESVKKAREALRNLPPQV